MVNEFIEGNRRFVANEFSAHPEYYSGLARAQQPRLLWIGCADSRASENVITDSKPGSIFVHRNVANIVAYNDVNLAAVLEYGVTHLKIPDIVVCGHYGCGGIRAVLEGVEETYIADWLLIADGAKERAAAIAQEKGLSREEHLRLLAEENVKLQLKHLRSFALLRNLARHGCCPRLHGWIYDVATGVIHVLDSGDPPEEE
jgi:carbonic anhydrase